MIKSTLRKTIRRIYSPFKLITSYARIRKKNKIFCIGRNKTGTTSMAELFRLLKIPVASQKRAELLVKEVANNKLKRFLKYIKYGGVAFQDVPFSLPGTFKILDKKFPNSKFILTIRDSPEIWYESLTNFHANKFGNGKIPNKSDLLRAKYVYPGWVWEINRLSYNSPEDDIYNKSILIQHYIAYNRSVIEYFKTQPEKLLVVNLKEPDAAEKICAFLNIKKKIENIPWKNKAK